MLVHCSLVERLLALRSGRDAEWGHICKKNLLRVLACRFSARVYHVPNLVVQGAIALNHLALPQIVAVQCLMVKLTLALVIQVSLDDRWPAQCFIIRVFVRL